MSGVLARSDALALPDKEAADEAAQAVADLSAFLLNQPTSPGCVRLCAAENGSETQVVIPAIAFGLFIDVLTELANGNAVAVAPVHAEMTTQEAADLLNVSRPFLIKLLDESRIPFRRVGNRRKVLLMDVLDYKRRDSERRRAVLNDLTREAAELGLYD